MQGTRWRARASVTHLPSHRPAGRNQQLHRHRKTQARAACRQRCLDRVYRHRGVLLTTYGMILHNSEVLAVSAEHDPDDGPLWDVMILDEVSIHPRDVRICPAGWVAWVALVAFFMMPYDHAVRRRWLAGGRAGGAQWWGAQLQGHSNVSTAAGPCATLALPAGTPASPPRAVGLGRKCCTWLGVASTHSPISPTTPPPPPPCPTHHSPLPAGPQDEEPQDAAAQAHGRGTCGRAGHHLRYAHPEQPAGDAHALRLCLPGGWVGLVG